nr:sugar transferase [Natranaerobius thermophilus]
MFRLITKKPLYRKYIKRSLDFLLSIIALILFAPFLIFIVALVRLKIGTPVFFKQQRPGLNERIFTLYKFRTMTNEKDEKGKLLPDDVRLTKLGKFLRKTSLDELPELFNVIKGDMSLVGPRPLLTSYLPYYTEEERKRHQVRPGITGLAQVSGRNYLDWEERLSKDVEYVYNITFFGDMKIILKTIYRVLKRDNIADNTNQIEGNLAEIRKQKDINL